MDSEYEPEVRRSRAWLWVLLALLVTFLAGVIAAGYTLTHNARAARLLHLESIDQARADQTLAEHIMLQRQKAAAAAVPTVAPAPDPQLTTRLMTLEGKVDDIQEQATAATGDASRAEGLLVAFAARRALDRGVGLGYIEGLLRQRFGTTQPQAIATILSASHQPVTLPDLQTGLDTIAPTLSAGGSPKRSWWESVRTELSGMVVVRRAGEPSTQPADRVARAQRMLEAGQVDSALAEVVRLSGHSAADKWIVAARRYLAGRGALDQIETAALLDPATSDGAPPGVTPPPTMRPTSSSAAVAPAKTTSLPSGTAKATD